MPARRQEIIDRLKGIDNLPTLPHIMMKLSRALNEPNCSAVDIERILVNDPAIAAQILKTVNSPLFFAGDAKISNLKTAVARLGFKETRNVALSTSVFTMFEGIDSRIFDRKEFWKHCLSTSLAAIEIGRLRPGGNRLAADELHLAGLVHDIGKIILDAEFADLFEESIGLAMKMNMQLVEAERVVMEIDHCEVGAMLAEGWHLPDSAIAAIRNHHNVDKAPANQRNLVNVVNMANYIVNTQELGTGGDFTAPTFNRLAWEALELSPEAIQKVLENVRSQAGELAEML